MDKLVLPEIHSHLPILQVGLGVGSEGFNFVAPASEVFDGLFELFKEFVLDFASVSEKVSRSDVGE